MDIMQKIRSRVNVNEVTTSALLVKLI